VERMILCRNSILNGFSKECGRGSDPAGNGAEEA
jgi:hypothetical protein